MTTALVLLGLVVLALALADRPVRRLPLSPALIYLAVGWGAGAVLGAPDIELWEKHASTLTLVLELAVLISLFAVGLRLRTLLTARSWRTALVLAGPAMVLTIVLAAGIAWWLLDLPWVAALLLAGIIAPTDPVLASDVQIRSDQDRDAVRLALTAEGGLNDGAALPAVLLALGLMGLQVPGSPTAQWWWRDLVWPVGGGALLGAAFGLALGWALRHRALRSDKLERDELVYVGSLLLALGLAHLTTTSSFVLVFVAGATLLRPLRVAPDQGLAERLQNFGSRCERLVEAAVVLALGVALHSVRLGWPEAVFALLVAGVVRPAAVLAVLALPNGRSMTPHQHRLVAWFGIRGIGSLYYLLFALQQGVAGALARDLVAATLLCVALSIVLHGVSATPVMARYQVHLKRRRAKLPPGR